MHKDFYASGFLYNPLSQQILLQQQTAADENSPWGLLESEVTNGSCGEETFRNLISKHLNIKISLRKIFYIYTRYADGADKHHSIYYAEVKRAPKSFSSNKSKFSWFTFKQIHKLTLSEQTKHDIMVGQRVIDSAIRKSLGQQTIG
jgi:hypothetical protein